MFGGLELLAVTPLIEVYGATEVNAGYDSQIQFGAIVALVIVSVIGILIIRRRKNPFS